MCSLHGFLTAHWDHELGRDGALRRPRRVQRGNGCARYYAGGTSQRDVPTVAAAEERRTRLPQRGWVFQPRVARNELPWEYKSKDSSTPTGLHQSVSRRMQPFQGWKYLRPVTQGSSFLATLG